VVVVVVVVVEVVVVVVTLDAVVGVAVVAAAAIAAETAVVFFPNVVGTFVKLLDAEATAPVAKFCATDALRLDVAEIDTCWPPFDWPICNDELVSLL
jgi:hypothetical protein